MRPVLSYASPGLFPFLCDALKKDLNVYHRSACRASIVWLSRLQFQPTAAHGIARPTLKIAESPSTRLANGPFAFLQTIFHCKSWSLVQCKPCWQKDLPVDLSSHHRKISFQRVSDFKSPTPWAPQTLLLTTVIAGCSRSDRTLQPTFTEYSPRLT